MVLYIIVVFSLILSGGIMLIGLMLSKKNFFDRERQSPFECGFSTCKESRMPFSLRFFILALIFVVFDVEIIILLPFVLSVLSFTKSAYLILYYLFLVVLTLGLLNEWNQNMLEWVKFY